MKAIRQWWELTRFKWGLRSLRKTMIKAGMSHNDMAKVFLVIGGELPQEALKGIFKGRK